MALDQEKLTKFRIQRKRLGGMLSDASEVINDLNMSTASENLDKLSKKVNNDTFKIQVIGTFKNGKSTFINSLLGEAVLPAYALPCTAVINEVKYGEKKEAILYFRNPLPENLPASISSKALAHMQKHNMKDVPPLHIEYSELEDYVVIPMGEDPKEMLLESPYEKVELFWPLQMLKEGVEIIDSPGLNESDTRARVTMDYLSKADAILFVLAADHLCSKDEMEFVENYLNAYGFTDPFFVVNRYDLIQEREKERIVKFAEMKLAGFTTNPIYCISAQKALDGVVKNDAELIEESRITPFVTHLTNFLTKDKGKIKLSQPARELKRILNNEALYKVIPSQRAMLDSSLDDVRARYEAAKPRLEMLRSKKEQLISKLKLKIEQSKHEFKRASNRNFLSVAESIPGWINAFQPKNKFSVIPTKAKATVVVTEITDFVVEKIEAQQKEWKKSVFQPLVEERSHYIFESAEQDLTNLFAEIDSLNVSISGRHDVDPDTVPLWQRIAAGAGGLLLGDIGLAFSGGVNGFSKDLAKVAALEIGAGALLYFIGALNPFTLVAVLLAAIITSWNSSSSGAMKRTKEMVSEQIVNQLTISADDNSCQMAEAICQKLDDIANGISTAIDEEIGQTEEQVQSIIAEMQRGQASIDARKQVINSCEDKITALSTELDAFTFELIEQK
ncbi:MAG: dynamin family protein [Lachnospiraceae bacterium]